MSECTHDCSTCGESCGERKEVNPFEKKPLRDGCRVGKVYGIVSGKGGVGKSMVTSQLAVALRREGYRTAILDADITGPSIPKAFGIHGRAVAQGDARDNGAAPHDGVGLIVKDKIDGHYLRAIIGIAGYEKLLGAVGVVG